MGKGKSKNYVKAKELAERWFPSFLVMGIIFTFSSIAGSVIDATGLGKEPYQINAHFFLFLLLCLTYYKATKNIFYSIVLSIIFAVVDEFHQVFTPFRSSSLFDIFIDTSGAFISGGLIWRFQHILPKKLKNWLLK